MKKQKIIITGAMGYLASELLMLYSGEARYKDIICIDNRFISGKVAQLRKWGMQFCQCSILDKDKMQELLKDADIVYHLAGITDVAYTAGDVNPERDKLIEETGVTGTRNVISCIPESCKLIFPSTHVVFEGLQETAFDIPENTDPRPVLTYAIGKRMSEADIEYSVLEMTTGRWIDHKNYVIVRLGSVYGYSGDTMRIGIMPNLFSKIASQNGTINLFGGGVQYKSMVHVVDVVRAMKFLAESDHTGTYHLSNENMTVKEVAQICKEINPKVTLTETADEIPNKGYTLSNKKLLDTGFTFRYNIRDAIKEMITRWSEQPQPTELEYIQKGGNEYKDQRGIIRNYELTEPINLIGWIESTKGSVRANHYHPIQEQKCLLIKGRYVSVTQDLSYPDAPVEYKIIRQGDVAVIRPNVAHTMVFLEDSLFLNLVNGEREHENYGITHTIPYILVDEDHRNKIMEEYGYDKKNLCRSCGYGGLKSVLDLGDSPLANNLLNSPDDPCSMYPLEMMWCPECYNCQLSVVVDAPKMFDNYLYVSSTSPVFREHFEKAAEQYIREFNPSVVWDIGSNDGVFLKPMLEKGVKVCGIEPAKNLAELSNSNGIPTVHGYFNRKTASEAYHLSGSPDIITASNVFAHADGLKEITHTVFTNLKKGGVFIVEVQYLMDTIKDLTFDNIYHEHVNYWSVTALYNFMKRLGYSLFHVEHIDTHGGSIRCYIGHGNSPDHTVADYLREESDKGVHDYGTYIQFRDRVEQVKKNVQRNMLTLKHLYKNIAGYGSPAKASTALNYYEITSDDIQYTIEDNSLKWNKILPGTGIPIGKVTHSNGPVPDIVIILAWNFYDSIRKKIPGPIPCVSIKDLQLNNIAFTKRLSREYTGQPASYLFDSKYCSYRIYAGDYWNRIYKYDHINTIPTCYEAMIELVQKIDKSKTIIDIGANCGMFCVPVSKIGYPVIAFDPVNENVEAIKKAASLHTVQAALSDKNGTVDVYVPECPDNAALDIETAVSKMDNKECSVETIESITFDTWIEKNPEYKNIGLIKIDVQGHELQVIKGAEQTLRNAKDLYILCEFDYSLESNTQELYDTIISYGYKELAPITNEDKLFYKA